MHRGAGNNRYHGATGATWHNGTGAPAGSLGVTGDFYLDNDNGWVYKKTGASTWGYQVTLTIDNPSHSLEQIALLKWYDEGDDITKAMTKCGQNLFGKLTQTAAWGLGALLSITGSGLPEEKLKSLSNLPSRVFYGVNDDAAITLRLLGVPRTAAMPLAASMSGILNESLPRVRTRLRNMDDGDWQQALGRRPGDIYHKVWCVLEGLA